MTLAAKLTDKQKWQRLLSSLRYSLYVIFHPFDGFWDLSRESAAVSARRTSSCFWCCLSACCPCSSRLSCS